MKLKSLLCGFFPQDSQKKPASSAAPYSAAANSSRFYAYPCVATASPLLIVSRQNDHCWKGSVIGPKASSKIGVFPAAVVQLLDTHREMLRTPSQRQAKKVAVPTVPGLATLPPVSFCSGKQAPIDGGYVMVDNARSSSSSYGSLGQEDEGFSSTTPVGCVNGGKSLDRKLVVSGSTLNSSSGPCPLAMPSIAAYGTERKRHRSARRPCSTEMVLSGNMEVAASPTRHRNSTGSSSSQASSGFESMKSVSHQYVNVSVSQIRGDSPPSRNSIHSSGSSLGSLERLDESGHSISDVNIAQLIASGLPDSRVLTTWLQSLQFDEYAPLFMKAGYDMATVARMTPEDLIAIGITKPGHRKRLTTEIHRLNIADTWPSQKPNSVADWLKAINLAEYVALFEAQNCKSVDDAMHMNWEDFEDIGVVKLGHVKRLVLAAKKLKDSEMQGNKTVGSSTCTPLAQTMVISCPSRACAPGDMRPFLPPANAVDGVPHILTTFHQPSKNGRLYLRATNSFRTDVLHGSMATSSRSAESLLSEQQSSAAGNGAGPGECYCPDFYHLMDVASAYPNCGVRLDSLSRGASSSSDVIFQTQALVHRPPQQSSDEMMTLNGCATPKRIFRKLDSGGPTDSEMMVANGFMRNGAAGTLPSNYDRLSSLRNRMHDGYPMNPAACMGACAAATHMVPPPSSDGIAVEPQQHCSNLIHPLTGCGGHNSYPGPLINHTLPPSPSDCLVFSLSKQATCPAEDGELSPAPSVDEFPPPPSPIMCEASIRHLKTIKSHPLMPQTGVADSCLSATQVNIIGAAAVRGEGSSTAASVTLPAPMAAANGGGGPGPVHPKRIGSLTSIESSSSTDTLPFANENVGTIKQKAMAQMLNSNGETANLQPLQQPQHSGAELASRKHVSEVFAVSNTKESSSSSSKSSAVFDDLGNMLKNLTDQLDAMLSEEPGV